MKRYTGRPLPPYRHLPGATPHPERSPEGHMYGVPEPPPQPLTREGWHGNEDFLFGVDLFNAGYFWEAHAFWERLWVLEGTAPEVRRFLRSLIQTAAACLKVRQERIAGARRLLDRASLSSLEPGMFGIDPVALARDARSFVAGEGRPPHLSLTTGDEK